MSRARALQILERLAAAGTAPRGVTTDSRTVVAGDLFVACPGERADGRTYIAAAIARGACAVVWESGDGFVPDSAAVPVPAVGEEGARGLVGYLADVLFGRPAAALWMAGVTGTNGKTTVSTWLAQTLQDHGVRCGVIGTLGQGFPGALQPFGHTTPDAAHLHRMLARLSEQGAQAVAMEVSSIGLDQERVNGVDFDVAIFTNFSRDHLEYHHTMHAYAAAKARLFELPVAVSVINVDDAVGVELARRQHEAGREVIAYTRFADNAAAVPGARMLAASAVRVSPTGLSFQVSWEGQRRDVSVRVVAAFNVSNLLAVIGALLAYGVSLDSALALVTRLDPPEGRMQLLGGVGVPLVVVDYAHTPDALGKVLDAVRETATARGGQVVCVFGCGGERDPGKRPLMGEIAVSKADRVVITSDNPRSEAPASVIDDIVEGTAGRGRIIVARAEAIHAAITEAAADDVILLAGKGHEQYQEIHGERLPFSDIAEATAGLQAWQDAQEKRAC